MVLASAGGVPEVVYFGVKLPKDEYLETLANSQSMDFTGGSADHMPALSLCPERSDLFQGRPGLIATTEDGADFQTRLQLEEAEETAAGLNFILQDRHAKGFSLRAAIESDKETGVFSLTTHLASDLPLRLQWLAAPVLPLPASASETIEFSGKWCGEFDRARNPITAGARMRRSYSGRTSHESFPGLVVPFDGGCLGFHYAWSGGHEMVTEGLPDGRTQVQFGNAKATDEHATKAANSEALHVVWGIDENDVAKRFQDFARLTLAKTKSRPVHYNCWEAVYFDHNMDVLKDIASRAAKLGAERFVLDDGWFKGRNDDTSSLGDWVVDEQKYPNGLTPLIDHVQREGMRFGIWFEPEMVNPDSDLARAHPEWILGGIDQPEFRGQLVLDFGNSDCRSHIYAKIAAILEAYDIDYVKWDHNRVLPFDWNKNTFGFYDILEKLTRQFPHVDFESCSSGGGRIDYRVLQYANRVWLSDSNDALERWKMQTSASTFFPSELVGSHVGPRQCHTSGRILPIEFRGWVAASRHMGFEMDPRELTEEEATSLKRITNWYKENRDWMHKGNTLQCPNDDPARKTEIQVASDCSQFVAMCAQMEVGQGASPKPLRLAGLDAHARYEISLRNPEAAARVSRGKVALRDGKITLTGTTLMNQGVALPCAFPATMFVIEGKRL